MPWGPRARDLGIGATPREAPDPLPRKLFFKTLGRVGWPGMAGGC